MDYKLNKPDNIFIKDEIVNITKTELKNLLYWCSLHIANKVLANKMTILTSTIVLHSIDSFLAEEYLLHNRENNTFKIK